MELEYKPSAVKQLKRLPISVQKKIIRKLQFLATEPLSGKALKGEFEGLYSIRAWPYRITFTIDKTNIFNNITYFDNIIFLFPHHFLKP